MRGLMRDGSGQKAIAQRRFEIGDEFLEDAGRRCDCRLDCGRLGRGSFGRGRLNAASSGRFHGHGFHWRKRSRWFHRKLLDRDGLIESGGGNFVNDFIDSKFGGRFVGCEIRNRLESGDSLRQRRGMRGSFNLRPKGAQYRFVRGEGLKFFESGCGLLGHAVLEIEANLFDAFGGFFLAGLRRAGICRFGMSAGSRRLGDGTRNLYFGDFCSRLVGFDGNGIVPLGGQVDLGGLGVRFDGGWRLVGGLMIRNFLILIF